VSALWGPSRPQRWEISELRVGWERALAIVGLTAAAALVGDLAPPPVGGSNHYSALLNVMR
jgi:hypothetical protein